MSKLKLSPEEHAARKAAKRAAWVNQPPAIIQRPLRAAQITLLRKAQEETPGAGHLLRVAVGVHELVKSGDGTAAKRLARAAEQLTMSLQDHLTTRYIEVTGVDPVEILKSAYALSKPQGLGMLHFREGGLTDEEAKEMVKQSTRGSPPHHASTSFDYVNGRALKLWIDTHEGRSFIRRDWYDHSEAQVRELCRELGVDFDAPPKIEESEA